MSFTRHTECRLGEWYENIGKERFGSTNAYKTAINPHAKVHDTVHDNLKFIEGADKRIENEAEITKNFQTMESASDELFKLLDIMIRENTHKH